jgi:hypothetical protein
VTDLIDDTRLTHTPTEALEAARDPLREVSAAVVARASLQAKARAYELRLTRWMAMAANQGAGLDALADAAGVSADEVRGRLAEHPELLDARSRERLLPPGRHRRW